MPRADWSQMQQYPLLVGPVLFQSRFEKIIWIITRRIKTLALQSRILSEARDRLLPKLMSGEIEV